jgi:hypothetical protein
MVRSPLVVALIFAAAALAQTAPKFTTDGKLEFPADYREWIYLSSGLGMTYSLSPQVDRSKIFDTVFVNPDAYREFVKTGRWPDQTIFVLEQRSDSNKTSGTLGEVGHYQDTLFGISAEVKDSKRFGADGEWGYFGFAPSRVPAGRLPKSTNCYTCHPANGAVENTFVQFYPTLLPVAKAKGTLKPQVAATLGPTSKKENPTK